MRNAERIEIDENSSDIDRFIKTYARMHALGELMKSPQKVQ